MLFPQITNSRLQRKFLKNSRYICVTICDFTVITPGICHFPFFISPFIFYLPPGSRCNWLQNFHPVRQSTHPLIKECQNSCKGVQGDINWAEYILKEWNIYFLHRLHSFPLHSATSRGWYVRLCLLLWLIIITMSRRIKKYLFFTKQKDWTQYEYI